MLTVDPYTQRVQLTSAFLLLSIIVTVASITTFFSAAALFTTARYDAESGVGFYVAPHARMKLSQNVKYDLHLRLQLSIKL